MDERLSQMLDQATQESPLEEVNEEVADHLGSDQVNILLGGGSSIVTNSTFLPEALLHGGEHWDDMSRNVRVSRRGTGTDMLPRKVMCKIVENRGLRRPTPNTWIGTTPASAFRKL
jgi:hypothetical protein